MTPRVTEAHEAARYNEILQAAYRCFAHRGLRATTMKDVAEEAGLSVGALYRYFAGKEALFGALASWAAERRRADLEELTQRPGADRLATAVAEMMGALASPEAERSVRLDVRLWAEALDDPEVAEAVRSAFGSVRIPLAEYPRAEQEAGRMRDTLDPEAVGRVVVSLLVGLELQRAHDDQLDLEAYRTAVRELLTGLGA
ncbi:MAG: TetR/AcrR family transcriptional regulator [Gemmatimonadota bacterium]